MIRHGVTAWNRDRRFQGQTDIVLDEEGLAQALRTGRRLADWPLAAVYTSDLARARQTAEPIAAAHGLPLLVDERLRERRFGCFEGLTHDEIRLEQAGSWQRWQAREPDFAPPGGGESLRAFHARVESVMRDLARRHAGHTVVAVTHGGVLDCVFRVATGLALEAPRGHELLNASLNRIAWDGLAFSLLAWGDVAHLGGTDDAG
ncbi:MAG: histidine phosphatase family protein [Burkholderiales bacterium]|nr:histidine phosphatase family protein [Burkholderiales bacterium]OJX06184.1 MAG: hypothetical protein BGO72_03740 [Burkholderiales bacterium 70-64]